MASQTSKPHIALAAGLGALLPFIPDLVKLIPGLPIAASNALCAVIVAIAYALSPARKKPNGEAGFVRPNLMVFLGAFALVACGLFATAAQDGPADAAKAVAADPGKATRDALKSAELACLGCAFPNLPKEARDACVQIDPVCKALAGMCEDPDAGK